MNFNTFPMLVLLFGIAGVLGLLCTLGVEYIARRTGFISKPSAVFRDHHKIVALGGGAGVMAATLVSTLFILPVSGSILAVVALAVACAILGLADDLRPLGPGVKIMIECVLTAAFVVAVTPEVRQGEVMSFLIGSFWIISITNAFNLIDVSDGLLSSACVVAFLGWSAVDRSSSGLAVILAGACLGFLIRNAPPAKIFLGDTGSLSLGAAAGGVTWLWITQHGTIGFVSASLVFAVPLLEMTFLVAVRLAKKRAPWRASRDHLAIRLRAAGWSRPAIICGAVVCGAGTLSAALLLEAGSPWYTVVPVVGFATLACAAAILRFAPAPATASAVVEQRA